MIQNQAGATQNHHKSSYIYLFGAKASGYQTKIVMERPGMGEWDTCMTRPDSEGQGLEKLDRGCMLSTR